MSTEFRPVSLREAKLAGRTARKTVPRSSHRDWTALADRRDPVTLLEGQNVDRLQWLVPVRRTRMSSSPFAFYQGAARIMATDLAGSPTTDCTVQLCGDAHLANFGLFASPERGLVFELNDFDETLPGPFEWDVKRLAASFTIAGQHRGFDAGVCHDLAVGVTTHYRTAMLRFAELDWLDMWYARVPSEDLAALQMEASKKKVKRDKKIAKKAKSKDHLKAARRLVDTSTGSPRFRSEPPLLVPFRELPEEAQPGRGQQLIEENLRSYRNSLSGSTRQLFDRYELMDLAIKVVGVGSVGTRCVVGLFMGRHPSDILLLQIREATTSVLEEHLPKSRYERHGRRVVEGQRLMQAASDIFLGSSKSRTGHEYYWRRLEDWKGSLDLETASRDQLATYAKLCGQTLARAHAVSGDPFAIASYLGNGTVFDKAIGEFAARYAAQNMADYEAFMTAIDSGALEAAELPG